MQRLGQTFVETRPRVGEPADRRFPDRLRQQVLLELALSIGGEADPDHMLRRTLALLVRRTASTCAGVLHRDPDGWATVGVTPHALAGHASWLELVERIATDAGHHDEPTWTLTDQRRTVGRTHHVFVLPGFGLLVLSRPSPLDARFATELVPVMRVLSRPLLAGREQQRRAVAEQSLLGLGAQQRGLLDALPHPVWLTDLAGRYLEVNEAFARDRRRAPAQILGRSATEVLDVPFVRRCAEDHAEVLRTADPVVRDIDVEGRVYTLHHSPYLDDRGEIRGIVGQRYDVTERIESLRQLEASENRLARVIAATNEGWWDTNLRTGEAYLSPRWWEIHGYQPGELPTTPTTWRDLCHPEDLEVVDALLGEAIRSQLRRLTVTVRVRHKHGQALPVVMRSYLEYDEQGQLLRVSGVTTDVTAQQLAQGTKQQFVSTISHELRTPLTVIGGALQLLDRPEAGTLAQPGRQLVELAVRNTQRLAGLIDHLLDIEKLTTGSMSFELSEQPLAPVIEQALADIATYRSSGISYALTQRVDEDRVSIDAERILQVLANFLSNATKFAPAGSLVEVRLRRRGRMLRTEVIDRGPGVPDGFAARAFQRFAQADPVDGRTRGGTGLGLAISREIVERLGGAVGYDSVPGTTAFWFDLPAVGDTAA